MCCVLLQLPANTSLPNTTVVLPGSGVVIIPGDSTDSDVVVPGDSYWWPDNSTDIPSTILDGVGTSSNGTNGSVVITVPNTPVTNSTESGHGGGAGFVTDINGQADTCNITSDCSM